MQVVPVPGANAALCALIASGLPASPFFRRISPKSKNRRQQLEEWQYLPATIILYEAPHRIEQVLQEVLEVWGDRQMAAARELTKLHEEFFRGMVSQCLTWLHENKPRGEFCLVIARGLEQPQPAQEAKDPLAQVQELLARGVDKKTALAQVAKANKIPKRELYNKLISEEEGINI
ncbi:MAG: SAM-dependent methyltransferase [Phascolarctobacterium faecium]